MKDFDIKFAGHAMSAVSYDYLNNATVMDHINGLFQYASCYAEMSQKIELAPPPANNNPTIELLTSSVELYTHFRSDVNKNDPHGLAEMVCNSVVGYWIALYCLSGGDHTQESSLEVSDLLDNGGSLVYALEGEETAVEFGKVLH